MTRRKDRADKREKSPEQWRREIDSHRNYLGQVVWLGADLQGAFLRGMNLAYASFVGANLDGADLSGCNLLNADLTGAHFVDTDFSGAHMSRCCLQGGCGESSLFYRTDLTDASLYGATFPMSSFKEVNLRGADCNRANFALTTFREADLREANFLSAYFVGIRDNLVSPVFLGQLWTFNGAKLNWQSADLIAAILLLKAERDSTKYPFIGYLRLLNVLDWEFLLHQHESSLEWVVRALEPWINADDSAPVQLKNLLQSTMPG